MSHNQTPCRQQRPMGPYIPLSCRQQVLTDTKYQVLQSSEELGLSNESVVVILKALGYIISHQPADKYESCLSNIVALQVKPLHQVAYK